MALGISLLAHDAYRSTGGPWDQPSLDALLSDRARCNAATFVIDGGQRIDGQELEARVASLAGKLRAVGVGENDVVSWQSSNTVDAVVALRACWRIGAVAAPLHHGLSTKEAHDIHTRVQPKFVINTQGLPATSATVKTIWTDGEALAAVLFTSGSSGTPKGAIHSQNTLAYKARSMASIHGLDHHDVVLMPAPLAHVSGLLNGVTLPGATPFTSVLMQRWDPDTALDLIERERVTFMVGPPTFFISMLRAASFHPDRVASLRLISSGGAEVSEDFIERSSEAFGAVVKRTYGSTEAPTVATSTPGDPSPRSRAYAGRAVGNAELLVASNGELLIRGPEVCLGYLDASDTQIGFDSDGWFHSGDLATLDPDGWLTIIGRLGDVIIRGGENISAHEIESLLHTHPLITAAIVLGYPDELMSEHVGTCIISESPPNATQLREWCVAAGLAKYKTPERVICVDCFPLLPSGKLDRLAMRALLSQEPER